MPETTHKGLPVRKYSAAVRGASGDALNGAMKVNPQDLDPGTTAYVVLEVKPNGDQFKPMDDGEAWEHVDILQVLRGAFLPAADALPFLDTMSVKLEELRVEETGQQRLGVENEQIAAHDRGEHKRKRKECPRCQAIEAAGAAELGGAKAPKPAGAAKGNGRGRGKPRGPARGQVVDASDRF